MFASRDSYGTYDKLRDATKRSKMNRYDIEPNEFSTGIRTRDKQCLSDPQIRHEAAKQSSLDEEKQS